MIDRLDQIDWKALKAESTPILLKCLVSPDPAIQKRAYYALDRKVVKSTAADLSDIRCVITSDLQRVVASFLVDFFIADSGFKNEFVLELLGCYAVYLKHIPYVAEPFFTRLMHLRSELARGVDAYWSLVTSSLPAEYRHSGISLIARLAGYDAFLVEGLLDHFPREKDPWLRRCIIWKMSEKVRSSKELYTTQAKERFLDLVNQLITQDTEPELRVVAAACLLFSVGHFTDERAVALVLAALKTLQQSDTYLGLYWNYDYYRLNHALVALGPTRGIPALLEAFDAEIDRRSVFYTLQALLYLAFGRVSEELAHEYVLTYYEVPNLPELGGPFFILPGLSPLYNQHPPVEWLTPPQRAVVQAIVNNDRVWEIETSVYVYYGLPSTRDQLRELLAP